ncbi:non-specific lipid transfer protein GPI-anchored 16-like [Silene latifolia]|uniref:non-specific lipid transfer protein GPI-anchored 16-like n=1 Tax=Silene latifolia TaxID=37657 RepID=UPI003D77719C
MMNVLKTNYFLAIILAYTMFLNSPINAQFPTSPCTASMLTSFTPCINYLTNSTSTGTSSPTSDCCNSLRSLVSNSSGCFCQIVTGGVPVRLPINRTLAISLPKACNQPGVPVNCKASAGSPLPAPGPTAAFSPSASPAAAVVPGPSGSTIPTTETPALAPVSDTTPTTEGSVPGTSTPTGTDTGTGTGTSTGTSSTPTSSASMPSLSVSPLLMFSSVAILMIKFF